MPTKESFDIDGLMVFRSDLTAVDQDGNIVAGVTTPDKYVPSLKEPLSGEQIGRYTNTTAYWREHSTYIPKKGEVIIYSDGGSITEGGTTVYIPKIKIGDGTTTVVNLPFTDSDTQSGIAGTLDTTNTSSQTPVASESLTGNVKLHKVAKTGSYDDLLNKPTMPTVNDAVLTIQKNSTTVDTFSANASQDKTIDITVPVKLNDLDDVIIKGVSGGDILVYRVGKTGAFVNLKVSDIAMPASTKYAASLSLSVDSSTYVVTVQLKDQDGNNLGSAQTIDLPLESVVVSGSYNAQTKKVMLTLQNGSTIEFSVADLVAGLQSEITAQNPLSADLVVDGTTNKVFTLTMKTKLDSIEAGAEVNVQSDWEQSDNTKDDYIKNKPNLAEVATSGDYDDLSNKPTIPTVPTHRTINHEQITDSSLGDANLHDGFYFPNAVQDYDGNWYGAVVIGDQVWLGENLRTTHYSDGVALSYRPTNTSTKGYFYPNDSADNVAQYGLLYNIPGALNGSESSDAIPSGIQGVSPKGWHIPSKGELNNLFTYIGNQTRFIYDNDSSKIAKSISSTFGWNSSNYGHVPGNVQINNNKTGLNLVPAGYFRGGSSSNLLPMFFGEQCHLVDTTYSSLLANEKYIRYNYATVNQINNSIHCGYSVRCVSDLTPIQFRNWYIQQYGSLQHHLPQEIPAQEQSDWNEKDTTDPAFIKNKPNLATVATSGSYNDLSNKPTIPDSTSDLTNDSGFITANDVPEEVLMCNYDTSNNTMDKTPAEIVAAKAANKIVVCKLSYPTTDFLFLNQANSNPFIVFTGFSQTTSSTSVLTAKYHVLRYTTTDSWKFFTFDIQQQLVSGTNIKTINGNSILGSGDLTIEGASQLNDLSDVTISSAADQQTLVYNPDTQNFENGELRKLWKNVDIVSKLDTEYVSHNGYIYEGSGNWNPSSTYKHWAVPVKDMAYVTIQANSSLSVWYTFFSSYTARSNTNPITTYATGYTTTLEVQKNTSVTIRIPSNALYMYLNTGNNSAAKASHVYLTGIASAIVQSATIYNGSSTPSSSVGRDGDIYIQTT